MNTKNVLANYTVRIKNEMNGACSTYGEDSYIEGFSGETWMKETIWKTQA
jgi:hypothetical protein